MTAVVDGNLSHVGNSTISSQSTCKHLISSLQQTLHQLTPHTGDVGMFTEKNDLLSDAMKRTSDWISSQEIPSDITVHVGDASFSLHKFPLVSKCRLIRNLVSEYSDADLPVIDIPDIPGGSEGFELAAKFCYGINFEIGTDNIAMLRCVAEFLEMTEDYAVGNLVGRSETYLNEVAFKSLAGTVSVLRMSADFTPMAEKVKLVDRCVDAIAYIACKESQFYSSGRLESGSEAVTDWWAEDFIGLRIDLFQRVLIAMMARGFKQYALGPILMLYAQQSLRGLEIHGKVVRKKIEARQEHEKRVVLETIVSLLPREKNTMSVSFLSMLLRSAIYLETTVACRLNLEKRMAFQLGQAVLDDLLIPSHAFTGDTLFDVDTVQRIMTNYLECEPDGSHLIYSEDEYVSPPTSDMERVGKLMEDYLAEIASDRNLPVSKFNNLAELIPEQARITEDGMYRAIDIYLKAHPGLSDMERKKVCSLMDCQKLSREACAHAAQNDRLPVQTVVQVLYYEQQRLRDVASDNIIGNESPAPPPAHKTAVYSNDVHTVPDELSILRKKNLDLKLELLKLKMKLKEMERSGPAPALQSGGSSPNPHGSYTPSADKPPLPRKSIMNSVTKKLGRLYPFGHDGITSTGAKSKTKPPKDRRHSMS